MCIRDSINTITKELKLNNIFIGYNYNFGHSAPMCVLPIGIKVRISSKDGKRVGKIIKIIGHKNDVGVDILSFVYEYNFSPSFPEDVYKRQEKNRRVRK